MLEGITDDGDSLVPVSLCCYFHRHIGEKAVHDIAGATIAEYQPGASEKADQSGIDPA